MKAGDDAFEEQMKMEKKYTEMHKWLTEQKEGLDKKINKGVEDFEEKMKKPDAHKRFHFEVATQHDGRVTVKETGRKGTIENATTEELKEEDKTEVLLAVSVSTGTVLLSLMYSSSSSLVLPKYLTVDEEICFSWRCCSWVCPTTTRMALASTGSTLGRRRDCNCPKRLWRSSTSW